MPTYIIISWRSLSYLDSYNRSGSYTYAGIGMQVMYVASSYITELYACTYSYLIIMPACFINFHVLHIILYTIQARSQGGSLGAEEPPSLNKRSTILFKRSVILFKKP